jgi:PAS domain S-box-containing protein
MYNPQLNKLIKKYFGEENIEDPQVLKFFSAVNNAFSSFDRDKQLNDHLFQINEKEYQTLNQKLQKLNESMEQQVKDRTIEIEDLARFPMENPNPIYRINLQRKIVFANPVGQKIKKIEYQGKKQNIDTLFKSLDFENPINESFDISFEDKSYIFFVKKPEHKNYINLYGADVTQKRKLRKMAEENLERLSNFLESTEDAYFIVYSKNPEKNLISNKWSNYFGFSPSNEVNVFFEKSKTVTNEEAKLHLSRLQNMKIGERISFRYQIKNPNTGEVFWLNESVTKQTDEQLNDVYFSGRITNITREHLYAMQMEETEARFQKLMDSVPVMVWVSDKNNKVTYTNQEMKNFLGFEMEQFKNKKNFIPRVHPLDKKIAIDDFALAISKRKPITCIFRLKDVNGNYKHITEKAMPRFYADGSFAGYIGAYFDLTKETEYQESLSREKEKLEIITRNSPDIVLLTNEKGIIEYVSPNVKRLLGYNDDVLINSPILSFVCKECKTELEKMNWIEKMSNGTQSFEYRMKCKNGNLIWVESNIQKIDVKAGKRHKLLMHNRDITKIKLAESILVENEKKYRGLFESMELGVIEMEINQKIKWVNQSFEKLSGYSHRYLKGKTASNIFLNDEASKKKIKEKILQSLKGKQTLHEFDLTNRKKETLKAITSITPVFDNEGKIKSIVSILLDVTGMRKLEKEIEKEKALRQIEIMKASIKAEEQQRQMLGKELHDGVGHQLAYTSLFLQMAKEKHEVDSTLLGKLRDQVEIALQEVKRISVNLVPLALSDLGLQEAIVELINTNIDTKSIRFSFNCNSQEVTKFDPDAQRNIYRIIQELINNTIKHANATEIKLKLTNTKSNFQIQYFNNGNHFDVTKAMNGAGLLSIINRVNFYQGKTNITSEKKQGSWFQIELPLTNIKNHG